MRKEGNGQGSGLGAALSDSPPPYDAGDTLPKLPPFYHVITRGSHHPFFAQGIVINRSSQTVAGNLLDSHDLQGELEDHGFHKRHLLQVEKVSIDRFVVHCAYLQSGFNGELSSPFVVLSWAPFTFAQFSAS